MILSELDLINVARTRLGSAAQSTVSQQVVSILLDIDTKNFLGTSKKYANVVFNIVNISGTDTWAYEGYALADTRSVPVLLNLPTLAILYDEWRSQGHTGAFLDFLNSLTGGQGYTGWTPMLIQVPLTGGRVVVRLQSFVGGEGTLPSELQDKIGKYQKADGTFTSDIAQAVDIAAELKAVVQQNTDTVEDLAAEADADRVAAESAKNVAITKANEAAASAVAAQNTFATAQSAIDAANEIKKSAFTKPTLHGIVSLLTTGGVAVAQNMAWNEDGIYNLSGQLSSFTANVNSIGGGTLTIYIIRPDSNKTHWTVLQSATVAVTATGNQTWTDSNFGILTLEYGDKVAFGGTCQVRFREAAGGALYKFYFSGSTVSVGNTYAISQSTYNADYQFNFGVKNSALGIERVNIGTNLISELNTTAEVVDAFNLLKNNNSNSYGISALLTTGGVAVAQNMAWNEDGIYNLSGQLASFTANVNSISGGTLTIFIVRPDSNKTHWTVLQSATVAVTATGNQTWTESDFGALTLAIGDKVAFGGTCQVRFRDAAGGALYKYYLSGSTVSVGSTYAISQSTTNADFQFNYSLKNKTIGILETQLGVAVQTKLNLGISQSQLAIDNNAALQLILNNNNSAVYGRNPLQTSGGTAVAIGNMAWNEDGIYNLSGQLATFGANIGSVSGGTLTIFIVRPDSNKTHWTVLQSATVAVTATGNQTWTESDFGALTLAIGDKVAFASTAAIRFRTSGEGALYKYYLYNATSVSTGSTYAVSQSGANADYQFNYSLKNKTIGILETQLGVAVQTKLNLGISQSQLAIDNYNKGLGTTELTNTIFSSSSPTGWVTAGSGWSNTADGLLTPNSSSIDYSTKVLRSGELYNNNVLVAVWRFVPQNSGIRIGFGFHSILGITSGTMIQIDDVNHLIKIHAAFSTPTGTSELGVIASSALTALTSGREYKLTLTRNFCVFTAVVSDCVSQAIVGSLNYGSNLIVQSGTVGYCQDTPAIWPMIGQALIRQFSLTCPVRSPFVFITGDSTTQGVGATPGETWANMIVTALSGKGVNAGQSAANFSKIAPEITYTLSKLIPKWVIMNLGFNDYTGVTAMQNAVSDLKTWADANNAQVAVMVQWHRNSSDNMSTMIAAQKALRNVRLIRGDIAMSTGDGSTPDSSKFYDGTHQNALGNIAIFNRFKFDLPELFV